MASYAVPVGYTWLPGRFSILVAVEAYEVMQVLEGFGRRWPRPVTGPRGLPMVGVFGRTSAGRCIVVYIRHDHDLEWTIVGSRPMTPGEIAEFDQWEAS